MRTACSPISQWAASTRFTCIVRTIFPKSRRSRWGSYRMASGRPATAHGSMSGLENEDRIAAIDTLANTVIATSPIGQAAQAVVYVPNAIPAMSENRNAAMTMMPAVPERAGTENLQPLGVAGLSTQLWLAPPGQKPDKAPTSVSLSDQGLVQVLEASVTGLEPGKPYVLALSNEASGGGALQPLQGFMTNPAGAAVVNAIGPIRQLVRGENKAQPRYLVIAPGTVGNLGAPVQVQAE